MGAALRLKQRKSKDAEDLIRLVTKYTEPGAVIDDLDQADIRTLKLRIWQQTGQSPDDIELNPHWLCNRTERQLARDETATWSKFERAIHKVHYLETTVIALGLLVIAETTVIILGVLQ